MRKCRNEEVRNFRIFEVAELRPACPAEGGRTTSVLMIGLFQRAKAACTAVALATYMTTLAKEITAVSA